MRTDSPVTPVHLDDQALKVSQVCPEDQDVQGSTVPKEREESPVSEVYLDHKVSPDPEETLEVQVSRDTATTEAGGRTVSRGVLEPKASPARSWEPHLVRQERTVYRDFLETKASLGHLEYLDHLVVMHALEFLD